MLDTENCAPSTTGDGFHLWSETRPDDLARGQLLTWRTKHVRLGLKMTMTGDIRSMNNGWTDTRHLLPPMTHWDGYAHRIPADLEWSRDVPDRIAGQTRTELNGYMFVALLSVEGIAPAACPFCGKAATWDTRGGFIGSMPHQDSEFSLGCCLRTGHAASPQNVATFWNTRAPSIEDLS